MTASRLADIAASLFAEDVDIPSAATSWSEAEAIAYFESGGTTAPSVLETAPVEAGIASKTSPLSIGRPMVWWSRADATISTSAYVDAHAGREKVSRVRLFHDIAGAVGEPGDLLALTGGWDYAVRVWRVQRPGSSTPLDLPDDVIAHIHSLTGAELLCELQHPDTRWVYDVDTCGYSHSGAALGLASIR